MSVISTFRHSLDHAETGTYPFLHWFLEDALPPETCAAIDALPVRPPVIVETAGKRETNNSTRLFFGESQRAAFAVCDDVANALQSDEVTSRLKSLCGVDLWGSYLRIEYCLDTDGFWLEPHTDIGAKLFTMLIYLSGEPESAAWGTDILDGPHRLVATAPYRRNGGLIFIPSANSWHGFHRRPIKGVRRSLIVNYVRPDWRSRHELAFPDRPVHQ